MTPEIRTKAHEALLRIIRRELDVTDVRREHDFVDDLGCDSLAMVELLLAAEEQFEIDVPDEDVYGKLLTVGDALDYLDRRLENDRRFA